MSNILKRSIVLLLLGTVVFTIVSAGTQEYRGSDIEFTNYQFIEDAKLISSRYSRPDDLSTVDPSLYIEITDDDEFVTGNSNFAMYYNEDIVSFKVLNKTTGYVWSTNIDNNNSGTYEGLLSGGVGIEYINIQKDMFVQENVGITDTVFIESNSAIENGIKLSLNFGGYCSTRACERLYPAYLEGRYTKDEMIELGLQEINIGFDLEVTLTDEGLHAYVPYSSIVENNSDEILLSSIIIFPALGATKMDEIPGYMVIPDGAGALIRYEDNEGKFIAPFEEIYYDQNYGVQSLRSSVTSYPLSMPIFGAVHGVYQNGFVGIIEQGDLNARLLVYPNGTHNLDYNLIFTKFDFRQTYRQSFSSDGTGGAMRYLNMSSSDVSISYNFLSGDDSSYVGIGVDYRDYLTEKGILSQLDSVDEDISILMDYIMADSESSFFGTNVVEMSTVEQVQVMYDYFMELGITNQEISLLGWNDGGYSGELPSDLDFENKLGSNRSFRDLIAHINKENQVTLVNNYIVASDDTNRVSRRGDVASGSNRFKLEMERYDAVHNIAYLLYPNVTKEFAFDDFGDYVDEDVNVLFNDLGHVLYSYYQSGYHTREDSYQYYIDIMEKYDGISSYVYPFAYAYQYTDSFHNAPIYNSQLKYYDDLVPLLEIVLKGSVTLYSNYLNYNSLGRDQILSLIDFGVNPAYVLTNNPSSNLKDTDISDFFTTEFDLWKTSIDEEYNYINDALKHVTGEYIVAREVLDVGIVVVTYSNGVEIYVNYSSNDYVYNSITIPGLDYYVGGVS